jgi:hypothetical protein
MTIAYLLIPLFFIALMIYVSWPLLSESGTAPEPPPAKKAKRRKQS